MASASTQEITQLLQAWGKGNDAALEKLTPLIHAELHRLARHYMARERPEHLLQTTALVNEAYLKLIDWRKGDWKNRAHFFGLSARLMRNILVDMARKSRRGGAPGQVSLDEVCLVSPKARDERGGSGRGAQSALDSRPQKKQGGGAAVFWWLERG